jgi:hypothetical protein
MSVDVPRRGTIDVHLLHTDARRSAFAEAAAILRHDLRFDSELIAPYPFPQHTLVDGPEGGMEYPMLTMSHGGGLTSHELWHQWFPMLVGTDEGRYGFMDEGLAGYLSVLSDEARLGRDRRPSTTPARAIAVPLLDANAPSSPRPEAIVSGYSRPGRMLRALEGMVGGERVAQALAAYASAWAYKHPTPWDFMAFMEQALGVELDAFWYRWFYSTEPG